MSNDNFQWTDELVLAFAHFTNKESPLFQGRYTDLDQFKKSNSPKPKVKENDWEILEYWNADGHHKPTDKCKSNGCIIKSVKRISDSEVFSVNDEITGLGLYSNETHKIKSMRLINGTIGLEYGSGGAIIIQYAKKAAPQPKQKERAEVSFHYEKQTKHHLDIYVNRMVESVEFPSIKAAIEKAINE